MIRSAVWIPFDPAKPSTEPRWPRSSWRCGYCRVSRDYEGPHARRDCERDFDWHLETCPDRPFWRMKP